MSVAGFLVSLFPLGLLIQALGLFMWFVVSPNGVAILALFATFYVQPLLCFRIHEFFFPTREKATYLDGEGYNPWFGAHQIQLIYIAFPFLEVALRLVPGLFSLWLRLWGSKVGKSVYWTPHCLITDRQLLEIGSNALVGHKSYFFPHLIKPSKSGRLLLIVKRVRVGDRVFIGAGSRLAPGVEIEDGAFLGAGAEIPPNQKVRRGTNYSALYPFSKSDSKSSETTAPLNSQE